MTKSQQYCLNGTLGEYLRSEEQKLYDTAVADLFGFNALQYGMLESDFLRESRISYCLKTDLHAGSFFSESAFLPIPANSLDLLLLPHTLEFSDYPQQSLREAERVLVPEGYVVITGINPFSLWGLRSALQKKSSQHAQDSLWSRHSFGLLRIKDWLNLLGFEIININFGCYQPPIQNQTWLQRLALNEIGRKYWTRFGGVYCILAKKRVVGMRVIKPSWKKMKLNSKLVTSNTPKDALNQKNQSLDNKEKTKQYDCKS
jgi:SAM-dependent methyltransferase